MIYIKENTTALVIPKVVFNSVDTIVFENQVTHKQIILNDIVDTTPFDYYYTIDISSIIDEFDTAGYDYKLIGENNIYASGIAIFGDFKPDNEAYHTEFTYKAYKG